MLQKFSKGEKNFNLPETWANLVNSSLTITFHDSHYFVIKLQKLNITYAEVTR